MDEIVIWDIVWGNVKTTLWSFYLDSRKTRLIAVMLLTPVHVILENSNLINFHSDFVLISTSNHLHEVNTCIWLPICSKIELLLILIQQYLFNSQIFIFIQN